MDKYSFRRINDNQIIACWLCMQFPHKVSAGMTILTTYYGREATDFTSSLTWLVLGDLQIIIISNTPLTHWGRDKMDAISQTTFSNAFSWMKMYKFRLTVHWSLFLGVQTTISHHWLRCHYLKQWCLDKRRIYASLGLNELKKNILQSGPCLIIKTVPKLLWHMQHSLLEGPVGMRLLLLSVHVKDLCQ